MKPAPRPSSAHMTSPPRNEPPSPSPIVPRTPIGSGPGTAQRASAPAARPQTARKIRSPIIAPRMVRRPRAQDALVDGRRLGPRSELEVLGEALPEAVEHE